MTRYTTFLKYLMTFVFVTLGSWLLYGGVAWIIYAGVRNNQSGLQWLDPGNSYLSFNIPIHERIAELEKSNVISRDLTQAEIEAQKREEILVWVNDAKSLPKAYQRDSVIARIRTNGDVLSPEEIEAIVAILSYEKYQSRVSDLVRNREFKTYDDILATSGEVEAKEREYLAAKEREKSKKSVSSTTKQSDNTANKTKKNQTKDGPYRSSGADRPTESDISSKMSPSSAAPKQEKSPQERIIPAGAL